MGLPPEWEFPVLLSHFLIIKYGIFKGKKKVYETRDRGVQKNGIFHITQC